MFRSRRKEKVFFKYNFQCRVDKILARFQQSIFFRPDFHGTLLLQSEMVE